jgi:KaiC/GvpD/RAD55 family RecA-like ATPase
LELDTYAEVSPSGTGVKLFCKCASPFDGGKKKDIEGEQAHGGKTAAIEVYDRLRYFAVTGLRLKGPEEPQERTEQVAAIVARFWPPVNPASPRCDFTSDAAVVERARKYLDKLPPAISGSSGHNATFHAACVLVQGFGLSSDVALALLGEFNQRCSPPWSERELQHKISQAEKQPGERNYLRNVPQERYHAVRVPQYKAPPPKHEPKVTTLAGAIKGYVNTLRDGKAETMTLGIGEVDYAVGGGVEPGELIILAARPSHGKSAVALQCMHVWTGLGMPCLMVSEEMSALALGKRALQYTSEIPQEHWGHSIYELDKDAEEYEASHAPAFIAESCGTVESAVEQIEKHVEQHGIRAAVVDYAQILRGVGKTRYEQVTNTSIALKQVAAKHKIALLMLCQLGRSIETRQEFVPVMSDIKDTGQLEQDADVILFLVWPYKIDSKRPANEYMFFVGKNRNRAINQQAVTCRFIPSRQMILESRPSDQPNYERAFEPKNHDENF